MPSTKESWVDSALPKVSLWFRSSKAARSVKVPPISTPMRRRCIERGKVRDSSLLMMFLFRDVLEHAAPRLDHEEIRDGRPQQGEAAEEHENRADRRVGDENADDGGRDYRADPEPRAADAGAQSAHARRIDFGHVDVEAGNEPAEQEIAEAREQHDLDRR